DALEQVFEKTGKPLSAVMVGDGPDLDAYLARAEQLPGGVSVTFHEPMPARQAFAMARTVVVPSRAESMPYIVLEVLAANRPLIATRTGGIPEIFGDAQANELVEPGSVAALAEAMLVAPPANAALHSRVRESFASNVMARGVADAYASALVR
ncbi:MAG: glycosyltransferase, partial [Pseudomonadota bacterium]